MRNKNNSRLLLLVAFLTILYSCRNDHFPEQDTYNNKGQFILTSKTISLQQSKHKTKLISAIDNAETELKKVKSYVSGKVISYGDGVSIDTENVIYIENGPNYHTYTFKINREGASENAPLENLVFSPLTDGTYRELLVSYNLTLQEKQALQNGENVDTKGKVTVTDLGTGSPQVMSKTETCGWVFADAYTWCSAYEHHNGEGAEICKAATKSQKITVSLYTCMDDGTSGGGSGGTGGGTGIDDGTGGGDPGSGTGEGGTGTEPCNGTGVLTGPQNPNDDFGDGTENCNGIPTQPNNPNLQNPCEKTKTLLARPEIQQSVAEVTTQAINAANDVNEGEIGRIERTDGTIEPADVSADHHVIFNNITGAKGIYHNHTFSGAKVHSPPDIDFVRSLASMQSTVDQYGEVYVGMIGANKCYPASPNCYRIHHYIIRFNGTASDLTTNYTEQKMNTLIDDYRKREYELAETFPYVDFLGDELNSKGLEKLYFETLDKMGLSGKVTLQRVDIKGKVNNITLDANGIPKATPCP